MIHFQLFTVLVETMHCTPSTGPGWPVIPTARPHPHAMRSSRRRPVATLVALVLFNPADCFHCAQHSRGAKLPLKCATRRTPSCG